jgi:hypothetical protein
VNLCLNVEAFFLSRRCKEKFYIRWNSTLYMLERIYEQKQAIAAYSLDHDLPLLNGPSYTLIGNVIRAIKPFEELTKLCSQERETASCIVPTVSTLRYEIKDLVSDGRDPYCICINALLSS